MWTIEDFMLDGEPMELSDIVDLVNSGQKPEQKPSTVGPIMSFIDQEIRRKYLGSSAQMPHAVHLGTGAYRKLCYELGSTSVERIATVLGILTVYEQRMMEYDAVFVM